MSKQRKQQQDRLLKRLPLKERLIQEEIRRKINQEILSV